MQTIWQDLRYGARMLLKSPSYTLIAVITMALGIGANTAIFSIVNTALLRSLPYANAEELALLLETNASRVERYPVAPANYLDWRRESRSFTDIAAISNKGWSVNLTGAGEPERLQGYEVSANLFELLGARASLGRAFAPDEDRPGGDQVVVLSHGFWRRRWAADPAIIGRTLTLNGSGYTVIGVMPPDFSVQAKTDIWKPLALNGAEANSRQSKYLILMGRLKRGVTLAQAQTELDEIARRILPESDQGNRAEASAPQQGLVKEVKPALLALLVAVGFVLLIACANIANLLLSRAAGRQKEIAVRLALGASRWRVVRQLLTESLLIGLLGGACGLLLALWGVEFLVTGLPDYLLANNSRLQSIGVDAPMLGFTLAVSLLTSMIFGLSPALQFSRPKLNESLKESGRGEASGASRHRLRSALIVAETALSLALLIGAGLMIKSFWLLSRVNPGYDPSDTLTFQTNLPEDKYQSPGQIRAFYQTALERIAAIPGVTQVGALNNVGVSTGFSIEGRAGADANQEPSANSRLISAGYFAAMKIPLLKGRQFTDKDMDKAPLVAIIDETIARRFFPNEDPIGKRLRIWDASREIVGVVGQVRSAGLGADPEHEIYLPYLQMTWSGMSFVARSSVRPETLAAAVRREIQTVDRDQPVYDFKTLETSLAASVAQQRFATSLLGLFATLALLLAAVGIYGVMAYSVAQRTREIGIRMALGARSRDVSKLVIGQGMRLVVCGALIGLGGALALTRLMETLLFNVTPTDPLTFAVITLLLTAVAMVACYIPARRATKLDPMIALRYE